MNSLALRTTARLLASLLLIASLFLLWRGHNAPGGGFAGGLLAATAFVLYAIAFTPQHGWRATRIPPPLLVPIGLAVALAGALIPIAAGDAILTGQWFTLDLSPVGSMKLGTPLLFDVGVYLVVVGVTLSIILPLMEEE